MEFVEKGSPMAEETSAPVLLPHHEQQDLCETRLPYRQGRKLTAVKVYSINNESRHLLVFGVPSLNLRQETKALFSRFGKLQSFTLTKYPSEQFTETYHAIFEDIQSARIAKKMLDTKNYYGGILHICYAPEFESVNDTRQKLLQRQKNVIARLKNLNRTTVIESSVSKTNDIVLNINTEEDVDNKLYMGSENNIAIGKRKADFVSVKHCKLKKSRNFDRKHCVALTEKVSDIEVTIEKEKVLYKEVATNIPDNMPANICEIVDFTSTETEVLTNINEHLNYNNFGKELIKKVPYKPVNKIKFNINQSSS